jgi:hypothetical protein
MAQHVGVAQSSEPAAAPLCAPAWLFHERPQKPRHQDDYKTPNIAPEELAARSTSRESRPGIARRITSSTPANPTRKETVLPGGGARSFPPGRAHVRAREGPTSGAPEPVVKSLQERRHRRPASANASARDLAGINSTPTYRTALPHRRRLRLPPQERRNHTQPRPGPLTTRPRTRTIMQSDMFDVQTGRYCLAGQPDGSTSLI